MDRNQIGRYRVVRELGRGGMGSVVLGYDDEIRREVAIKLLLPEHAAKPDTVERLYKEAQAVNIIKHPSVVQINEIGQTADGSTYLVMEYLEGETLAVRLKRVGQMKEYDAISIVSQLASVLEAAHSKGIVHRDVKPGNIMLVPDEEMPDGERVKLLDFGVAKLADGLSARLQRPTQTGALVGSPRYMAPEQCLARKDVDGKADVYALGIVLYELFSGAPPFTGFAVLETVAHHISSPVPPLPARAPGLSPSMVTLIHSMLAKDPADRPEMKEVLRRVRAIRQDLRGSLSGAAAIATLRHSTEAPLAPPPAAAPVAEPDTWPRRALPASPSRSAPALVRDRISAVGALPASPIPVSPAVDSDTAADPTGGDLRTRPTRPMLRLMVQSDSVGDSDSPLAEEGGPPTQSVALGPSLRRAGLLFAGLALGAVGLAAFVLSRSSEEPASAGAPSAATAARAKPASPSPAPAAPAEARAALPTAAGATSPPRPSAAAESAPATPATAPAPPSRGSTEALTAARRPPPSPRCPALKANIYGRKAKLNKDAKSPELESVYRGFDEYYQTCGDGFINMEMGVLRYRQGDYLSALKLFEQYKLFTGEKSEAGQHIYQQRVSEVCALLWTDLQAQLSGKPGSRRLAWSPTLAQQASELCPDPARFTLGRGELLCQLGDPARAAAVLRPVGQDKGRSPAGLDSYLRSLAFRPSPCARQALSGGPSLPSR